MLFSFSGMHLLLLIRKTFFDMSGQSYKKEKDYPEFFDIVLSHFVKTLKS